MTTIEISKDKRGFPLYDLKLDEAVSLQQAALAADTDTTLTVPAGSRVAIVSGNDHFFVQADAVITLPTPGAAFAAGAIQNLTQINVEDVTTLHFRSRNVTDISVTFYG